MLTCRKVNNEENCVAAVLCTIYNGAQRYKQFLQVGRLYQALMLLFYRNLLSISLFPISWCCICIYKIGGTSYSLPFNELSLVGLALDLKVLD